MERYKIFELLGAGGAGQVFKGYDSQLQRYVAMKRLFTHEESLRAGSNTDNVKQEAAALASLRHPNIVSVFGVEGDETGTYIIMELIEGDDLGEWLSREGRLSVDDFKQLAALTLEALLAAHELNILHRDLKPENIKVTRLPGGRFQAKIIDFGLAKISLAARKQTQDQAGNILGSVNYMAPEQMRREEIDNRADIYALGCVYYEALSGVKPFAGGSVQDTMSNHLEHRIMHLNERCPELPEAIGDWVMWLLALDPDERPASASQALTSLGEAFEFASSSSVAAETTGVVIVPQPVHLAPRAQISTGPVFLPPTERARVVSIMPPPREKQFPWPLIITAGIVLLIGAVFYHFANRKVMPVKLGGYATGTKGSWRDEGDDREKVFDGKTSTFFNGPNPNGMWVGLDLGVFGRARILRIRYFPREAFMSQMVGGKFQASNDSDFLKGVIDLHTITIEPPAGWVEVPVDSGAFHRYIRYLSPEKSSGNVAEIEFYGIKEKR